MTKLWSKWVVIGLVAASITGCANGLNQRQVNTATGAVIGGVAGNLVGKNTATTLGGAALGGVIGSQVY